MSKEKTYSVTIYAPGIEPVFFRECSRATIVNDKLIITYTARTIPGAPLEGVVRFFLDRISGYDVLEEEVVA